MAVTVTVVVTAVAEVIDRGDFLEDYIEQDEYRSQIASLNNEIRYLREKIRQKEHIDKFNAFDNPTEYKGFSGNYAKIQPLIEHEGYEIPIEPKYEERRSLKRFYSAGGWCIILQFAVSTGMAKGLVGLILSILKFMNPDANVFILQQYMQSSSIFVSLNMLVYLVCNVLFAFIGMKWAGIKPCSIISTKNFSFGLAVQYCMTALFLWVVAIYGASGISDIFEQYGYSTVTDYSNVGKTTLGIVIMNIYTCIIAPITEELFFRGMLLKVFSKANQRFAIFATALFFGLAHGNIPQFILAFALGIMLALITMKHSSIIPAITVHMFINTFSSIFGYIGNAGETAQQVAIIILLALAVFGLIMFLVFFGDNHIPSTTPKQATRGIYVAVSSLSLVTAFFIQLIYMVYLIFKKY